MENENDIVSDGKTDIGFSEKKTELKIEQGKGPKNAPKQQGKIFQSQKKAGTIFQAKDK